MPAALKNRFEIKVTSSQSNVESISLRINNAQESLQNIKSGTGAISSLLRVKRSIPGYRICQSKCEVATKLTT